MCFIEYSRANHLFPFHKKNFHTEGLWGESLLTQLKLLATSITSTEMVVASLRAASASLPLACNNQLLPFAYYSSPAQGKREHFVAFFSNLLSLVDHRCTAALHSVASQTECNAAKCGNQLVALLLHSLNSIRKYRVDHYWLWGIIREALLVALGA